LHASFDDGEIYLLDGSRFKLRPNSVIGLWIKRKRNASAGLSVEAVKQPVVASFAELEQLSAEARHKRVQQAVITV